jgi:hypothetical protein
MWEQANGMAQCTQRQSRRNGGISRSNDLWRDHR